MFTYIYHSDNNCTLYTYNVHVIYNNHLEKTKALHALYNKSSFSEHTKYFSPALQLHVIIVSIPDLVSVVTPEIWSILRNFTQLSMEYINL